MRRCSDFSHFPLLLQFFTPQKIQSKLNAGEHGPGVCNPAISGDGSQDITGSLLGNSGLLKPLGKLPKNRTISIILQSFIHMFFKTGKLYYIYIYYINVYIYIFTYCMYIYKKIYIYINLFFANCPRVNHPTIVLHWEPINFSTS